MEIQLHHWVPGPRRPPMPTLNGRSVLARAPPSGDCTMPVRRKAVRMPASTAGCGGRFPGDTHLAEEVVPGPALLGEDLVAPIAVVPDRRAGHQHPGPVVETRQRGGEQGGGGGAGLEHDSLALVGPSLVADAGAREVDDRVDALEAGQRRWYPRPDASRSDPARGVDRTTGTAVWPAPCRAPARALPMSPLEPVMATFIRFRPPGSYVGAYGTGVRGGSNSGRSWRDAG